MAKDTNRLLVWLRRRFAQVHGIVFTDEAWLQMKRWVVTGKADADEPS